MSFLDQFPNHEPTAHILKCRMGVLGPPLGGQTPPKLTSDLQPALISGFRKRGLANGVSPFFLKTKWKKTEKNGRKRKKSEPPKNSKRRAKMETEKKRKKTEKKKKRKKTEKNGEIRKRHRPDDPFCEVPINVTSFWCPGVLRPGIPDPLTELWQSKNIAQV